jgi:hypothetical protein
MDEVISLGDVYDKNLNFLIGSGASVGLFPTLALGVKCDEENSWSLEDLATKFEAENNGRRIPLFMHYYSRCIRPAQEFTLQTVGADPVKTAVVDNYQVLLEKILTMVGRRKPMERRCNLFTTNYDGCIPLVADKLVQQGGTDFVLNDGARGFFKRYVQASNFTSFLCQTGVFDRHQTSVPQVNLIHLHGSVYWRKEGESVLVDYGGAKTEALLSEMTKGQLTSFSTTLDDNEATLEQLEPPEIPVETLNAFWTEYTKLPIVNPTKWKFHETVFDEHYYQMLRMLSYELEKPNAVLITFGFSFADEHILNLVRRSLSNPHLQVFVCCYNQRVHDRLSQAFRGRKNVRLIVLEDAVLDFAAFHSRVLTWDSVAKPAIAATAQVQQKDEGEAAVGPNAANGGGAGQDEPLH